MNLQSQELFAAEHRNAGGRVGQRVTFRMYPQITQISQIEDYLRNLRNLWMKIQVIREKQRGRGSPAPLR
jgi:hypothetical protein